MSTSVHYKGVLSEPQAQEQLLAFLREYAQTRGWGYKDVDDAKALLKGVILSPGNKMESAPFLFDPQGHLHSLGDLIFPENPIPKKYWIVSVKTHFAGVEAHIVFINLLRQVKEQFFPNLNVTDESDYWTHNDEAQLRTYFARLTGYMEAFKKRLENDVAPGEDKESLFENITRADEMAKREVDAKG
jgi:hypothetical protein